MKHSMSLTFQIILSCTCFFTWLGCANDQSGIHICSGSKDTAVAIHSARRTIDTAGLTDPTEDVVEAKCKSVEASRFKKLGCCAELCPSLMLKDQDCCCDSVFIKYEALFETHSKTPKGPSLLGSIANDFIFSRCKSRYPEKVKAIQDKYIRKVIEIPGPTGPNDPRFE